MYATVEDIVKIVSCQENDRIQENSIRTLYRGKGRNSHTDTIKWQFNKRMWGIKVVCCVNTEAYMSG